MVNSLEDWKKHYKFVYCCSNCKEFYGSDFLEKVKLCPKCLDTGGNFKCQKTQ